MTYNAMLIYFIVMRGTKNNLYSEKYNDVDNRKKIKLERP